jgi:hypothetical protein
MRLDSLPGRLNWMAGAVPYVGMDNTHQPDQPNQPASRDDAARTGPEAWVREAIAQQEEHLARSRTCQGLDATGHSWDWFSPRPGVRVEQCWRCRVTRTDDDYQALLRARMTP